jgi:hypothetical protein
MKKISVVCVLFSSILSGCAHIGVTTLKQYPPKSPDCPLEVFSSESEVSKPFEVVCLIDSQKKAALGESSISEAIEASKSTACQCGADGILFISGGTQSANAYSYGSASAILKAIKYKSDTSQK